MFTINEIEIFHIIAEWYLLFFAKFRSHQKTFTINEIEIFHIIAEWYEWYLLFFAKFRSYRVENKTFLTESQSYLNAPVLMTEPP